jgi:hypothetical protein
MVPGRRDDAQLGHLPAQGVDRHRPLPDQEIPHR